MTTMSYWRRMALFFALFGAVSATSALPAAAQGPDGSGFAARLAAAEARVRRLPPATVTTPFARELNISVDAMAIIADWRARDPSSQSGTLRRSGVRINGTPSHRYAGRRQVLFACPPGAFLDVTVGTPLADGTIVYDVGPRATCGQGQALVFEANDLYCLWYTPVAQPLAVPAVPEIRVSTIPPVTLLGECITQTAEIVPAIPFPSGLVEAAAAPCGGSGVTINGRVTGHSANCGR